MPSIVSLLVFSLAAVGCGSSDKGAGKWDPEGTRSDDHANETNPESPPISENDRSKTCKKVKYEKDLHADGSPEKVESWTYYPDATRKHHGIRKHEDDEPEVIKKWSFNRSGDKQRYIEKNASDDRPQIKKTWDYSETGYSVRHWEDTDGDGTSDYIAHSKYNGTGQKLSVEKNVGGGAQTPDRRLYWEYNDEGQKLRHAVHKDEDDRPEKVIEWNYNDGGQKTKKTVTNDGEVERINTWQYNSEGNLLERKKRGRDFVDERIETKLLETVEYDEAGRKVRRIVDNKTRPTNGEPASEKVQTWVYKDQTTVERTKIHESRLLSDKPLGDHKFVVYTTTKDAQKNPIRRELDRNLDGKPEQLVRIKYEDGNRVRKVVRPGADAPPSKIITWSYDERGDVTEKASDKDGDGQPDQVEKWKYNSDGKKLSRKMRKPGEDAQKLVVEKWRYDDRGHKIHHELRYLSAEFQDSYDKNMVENWDYKCF